VAIVALAGGVGGAKLALGLARLLSADELAIVVNTGDDFEHLGLKISPDLDTVMYTLAGLANPDTGWGLSDETWSFLKSASRLGIETWFNLGDQDLAVHVERTRRLRNGDRLYDITQDFCRRLGVTARILPMTDDPVHTIVHTDVGSLPFQEYFVHQRCQPRVTDIEFVGIASATPSAEFLESLTQSDLVVYCPSNPFVSIAPILALAGIQALIAGRRAQGTPVVAISPIVGGVALKGPAAKMMNEMGSPSTVAALAKHYAGQIDGLVIDHIDAQAQPEIEALGMRAFVTDTIMKTDAEKIALAAEVLHFGKALSDSWRQLTR
jgi:LPPG:FO 2-phospho-L-lactate transferase